MYLTYGFLADFTTKTTDFAQTILLGVIINGLTSGQDKNILIAYVILYAVIQGTGEVLTTFFYSKKNFHRRLADYNITEIVIEKYKSIPVKFRNSKEFAEIERKLNIHGIRHFVENIGDIFLSFYQAVLILGTITFIDANILIISIVVSLISFYLRLKNKKMYFENRDRDIYNRDILELSVDNFKYKEVGLLDDNVVLRQNFKYLLNIYKKKLSEYSNHLVYYFKKVERLANSTYYLVDTASAFVFVLIYLQGIEGVIQIGTLTILVTNFTRLSNTFTRLASSFTELYGDFVEMKFTDDFFKYEFKDLKYEELKGKHNLSFEFQGVSFSYPETDKEVIKNLNLKFEKGDIIGILGENGSGKSTLVKLLHRIYLPTSGRILLNGIDTSNITDEEYFSVLGCLPQEEVLEKGLSIQEIIQLGDTHRTLEKSDILEASRLSESEDFVEKLDYKYEQLISPSYNLFLLNKFSDKKFVSLSPGQSRKLSLAKIFYSHKPIIILDEPTSNVDPVASNKIFENFAKLKKRQIVIIVTHDILRLNKVANKILMMDQGEMVEFGDTESLRADKNSKYSELLRSIQDTIN